MAEQAKSVLVKSEQGFYCFANATEAAVALAAVAAAKGYAVPIHTVYMLIGLPGSGKSTWARMRAAQDPNCVVVNRDAVRHMVRGGDYTFDPALEPAIKDAADAMLLSFVGWGFDVILDETHVSRERRAAVLRMLKGRARAVAVVFRDAGDELIDRRMREARGYTRESWAEVIGSMRAVYEPPSADEEFDEVMAA